MVIDNTGEHCTLRQRFLEAVRMGQLGTPSARGVVVTFKEFKVFFSDVNYNYVRSFLAAAALEEGRSQMTHTKYLIRLGRGFYLVRSDVFEP